MTEKFVLDPEYAHFLQNLYELRFDYILQMLSTKMKEQHADCIAAYSLRSHQEMEDSFSRELEGFIVSLADSHAVGDHGTGVERIAAYKSVSALARLNQAIFGKEGVPTAAEMIQQCGYYDSPNSLSSLSLRKFDRILLGFYL